MNNLFIKGDIETKELDKGKVILPLERYEKLIIAEKLFLKEKIGVCSSWDRLEVAEITQEEAFQQIIEQKEGVIRENSKLYDKIRDLEMKIYSFKNKNLLERIFNWK